MYFKIMVLIIAFSVFSDLNAYDYNSRKIVYNSMDFRILPINNLNDLLTTSSEFTKYYDDLHHHYTGFDQVGFIINGFPADFEFVRRLDLDSIDKVVIYTKYIPAKYIGIYSAIVEIDTKKKIYGNPSGFLSLKSDHILSGNNTNSDNLDTGIEFSLLPLLGQDIDIALTGSVLRHDSRFKDYYPSHPNSELTNQTDENGNYENWLVDQWSRYNPYEDRDELLGFDLDKRNFNQEYFNLSIDYEPLYNHRVQYSFFNLYSLAHPYDHEWHFAMEYYQEIEEEYSRHEVNYSHDFSDQIKINLLGSYEEYKYREFPSDLKKKNFIIKNPESFDLYYLNPGFNLTGVSLLTDNGTIDEGTENAWAYYVFGNPTAIGCFISPGTIWDFFRENEKNETFIGMDLSWDKTDLLNLNARLAYERTEIENNSIENIWDLDPTIYENYLENVEPFQTVAEGEPLIDIWPDSPTYGDTLISTAPEDLNFYTEEDIYQAIRSSMGLKEKRSIKPSNLMFSLGNEMNFDRLYLKPGIKMEFYNVDYDYSSDEDFIFSWDVIANYEIFGNFFCEIGYKSGEYPLYDERYNYDSHYYYEEVFQDLRYSQWRLGLDYYFKDIINLSAMGYSWELDDTLWYFLWDKYIDEYYYFQEDPQVKGIDLSSRCRLNDYLNIFSSYSYCDFENIITLSYNEEKYSKDIPPPWYMEHNAKVGISLINPHHLFSIYPEYSLTISLLYSIASGRTYESVDLEDNWEEEVKCMPHRETLDLKINNRIRITGKYLLEISLLVNNIFNKKNYIYVYPKTGSPYYDGSNLAGPGGYTPVETQYIHDLSTKDPANIEPGRNIFLKIAFYW